MSFFVAFINQILTCLHLTGFNPFVLQLSMESVADEAAATTTTSHFRGPSTEAEGSEVTAQGKDTLFMSNDSLS